MRSRCLLRWESSQAKRAAARILRNPGHLSRTGRDGTMPRNGDVEISSPRDNAPVLIGGIVVPPTMGDSGRQDILKRRQSTSPRVGMNAQKFDASVNGNLINYRDSAAIFSKVMRR